jgi:hypothetical protein
MRASLIIHGALACTGVAITVYAVSVSWPLAIIQGLATFFAVHTFLVHLWDS